MPVLAQKHIGILAGSIPVLGLPEVFHEKVCQLLVIPTSEQPLQGFQHCVLLVVIYCIGLYYLFAARMLTQLQ